MKTRYKNHNSSELIQALCAFGIIVHLICTLLDIFGVVSLSFHGAGVDSAGNIYIGRGSKIEVVQNGEVVDIIRKYTSREYVITISDDTLLLFTSRSAYNMDLLGDKVIDQHEFSDTTMYNAMKAKRYEHFFKNGKEYFVKNIFGLLLVYEDNNLVYHMPVFDYIVLILRVISFPLFFFAVYWFRKRQKSLKLFENNL